MPYKDPQKRKEYNRQYRLQHLDAIRKYDHDRYPARKEYKSEYNKLWYEEHKQEVINRVKEYTSKHPEVKARSNHKYNQKKNAPYHMILEKAGVERVCSECGSKDYVCTHHLDGNHNNNSINNLQWLCVSCHGKLHRKEQLARKGE